MQEKKLILANLKDAFPDESDVDENGYHLNKDAVEKQVDLYDSIMTSIKVWNQERCSFPEKRDAGWLSRCCCTYRAPRKKSHWFRSFLSRCVKRADEANGHAH